MLRFEAFRGTKYSCDSLGEHLLIEIFKSYGTLSREFARLFTRYGLSEPQFNILVLLAKVNPDGLLLTEIGRRMLVTKANITGLVDRLERQGLVRRMSVPEDRRTRRTYITDKGIDLLDSIFPVYCSMLNRLMALLGDDEKERLVDALGRLRTFVKKVWQELEGA